MKKILFLSIFSLLLFTGCRTFGGGVVVSTGYPHSYNTPPAHAPAYGNRSHHRYHYYPNAEFYFDIDRNMYFYLDSRGEWTFSLNLPLHLRSHLYNGYGYVEFELENDRPYLQHRSHRSKYNAPRYRNKWKYKRDRKYKNHHKYKNSHNYRNDRRYKSNHKYNDHDLDRNRRHKSERRYKSNHKYNDHDLDSNRRHKSERKSKSSHKNERRQKNKSKRKYKDEHRDKNKRKSSNKHDKYESEESDNGKRHKKSRKLE